MTNTTEQAVRNALDIEGEERLYHSLDRFWHPVLFAHELGEDSVQVVLLGRRLVVARLNGEVRAFADRCAHRGTAVSLGWIEDDCIRCPYHGWKYDADGRCVEIPAREDVRISPRAKLQQFRAAERNGLIYVCLVEEPRFTIPEFPEFYDTEYRVAAVPAYDWNTGSARRTENFVDFSHFAWIHDKVLASRDDPLVPDHEVHRAAGELRTTITVGEPANTDKTKLLGIDSAAPSVPGERNYRVAMPFTVWLQQRLPGGTFVLFMAACPIGPKKVRSFTFNARTFAKDDSDETFIKFQQEIAEADRIVAESQTPEELPVDLSLEMYVKGADQMAVEYRRWMIELMREDSDAPGVNE